MYSARCASGIVGHVYKPAERKCAGAIYRESTKKAARGGLRCLYFGAVQRWRALKRGLLLQITNTLPRRRTTLQSRCRCLADLSEDKTFMAVFRSSHNNNSAAHCIPLRGKKGGSIEMRLQLCRRMSTSLCHYRPPTLGPGGLRGQAR